MMSNDKMLRMLATMDFIAVHLAGRKKPWMVTRTSTFTAGWMRMMSYLAGGSDMRLEESMSWPTILRSHRFLHRMLVSVGPPLVSNISS